MIGGNKQTFKPLLLLFIYWIVCNTLIFAVPLNTFKIEGVKAVDAVFFVDHSALKPPLSDSIIWNNIALPDDWYQNHVGSKSIWYRAILSLTSIKSDEVWAIYLPSVTHNAAVYINGYWVGQGGSFDAPVSRHHNQPLFFTFSKDLLLEGENQIDIHIQAASYTQGLMDQFYLAPAEQLVEAYEWKVFVRVDYVQWITLFMYIAIFIVLIFWIARPQDTIYGLYALQLFLWATHNLNLFINEIPISVRLWEAMNMATLGWTVVVMIMFNHRYIGKGNKKVERLIVLFTLLGTGIFFLPDLNSVLLIGYSIWDFFVMLLGIYALYYLLHNYRHKPNKDAYLMMLAGIPILALGLHDILVINHILDRREGMTMQFSIVPTIILFSWFLIRRFVLSINDAEMLAATLERRVEEKQQSLEIQYQQLNEFEKQGVLTKERERIMRDMHDGIGGQLISIVTLLTEHTEPVLVKIREKIQHSIGDLRFVIDSLDPLLHDLSTLLAVMRMRLSEQLANAGIELEWGITDLPAMEALSPSQSLHIMRIVQEAVTNSIKHSKTKMLRIATGVLDTQQKGSKLVFIDVIDYGIGAKETDDSKLLKGRGLTNMKYRADQLNADFEYTSLDVGIRVRLILKGAY